MITKFKIFENIGSPELIIAVKLENLKNIDKLIKSGVDVNCKDHLEWTPLLWAIYSKNIVIIKKLIDAGADINYKALHHISGTKKMVDFYDLAVDKEYYEGGYKRIIKWIEINYPHFVAAKKFNI